MYNTSKMRSLLEDRQPGHTLPRALYRDEDVLEFDIDAIFSRNWLQVALEIEIRTPGSWITVEIGEISVILWRRADGKVNAFHNTCRHRGARICVEAAGQTPRLVCPYHQWTYGQDGSLLTAPQMEGLDKSLYGLRHVAVETIAGLIFICLAGSPPPFEDFRAAITPYLAPYDFTRSKIAHRAVLDENANWKLVLENGRECYHCRAQHPQLNLVLPNVTTLYGETLPKWMTDYHELCAEIGLTAGATEGEWYDISRYPLIDGVESMTMDGKPAVAVPLGSGKIVGGLRWALQPNSFSHVFPDYAMFFSAMPAGPQRTLVTATWLVHENAEEGRDYQLGRLTEVWNETNKQDWWLSENNQMGVNSPGYRPGPYALVEGPLRQFVDWYCKHALEFLDSEEHLNLIPAGASDRGW